MHGRERRMEGEELGVRLVLGRGKGRRTKEITDNGGERTKLERDKKGAEDSKNKGKNEINKEDVRDETNKENGKKIKERKKK